MPNIPDQREEYLVKALRAPADVIAPITDEQILDLAYNIARVRSQ